MRLILNLLIFVPLNLILFLLWGIQFVLLFTIGMLGLGVASLGGYRTEPLKFTITSAWIR